MASGAVEAVALALAAGVGGTVKWLVDIPQRSRASRTAEANANLTAWEKLHEAQAADLSDLRNEIRQMRLEHGEERVRCAEQIAGLEAALAGVRATLAKVEDQLHEYKTQGVPIALEEAGRMAVNGFLREMNRIGSDIPLTPKGDE